MDSPLPGQARSSVVHTVITLPTNSSRPLDEFVRELCHRLHDGIERATQERAHEIVKAIFAAANGRAGTRSLKREMRQAIAERRRLLSALTRRFLRDIEQVTRTQVRQAVRQERTARARAAASARTSSATAGVTERRPRRRPVRPPPPPLDPQQIKRDAETRRLRALLRPANEEFVPLPPASPPPPPAPSPPPSTTPGLFLRTLERDIQDAVPLLGTLGPERCGAQIAAWTGQVRQFRDHLPADIAATMRPAFRIFLEHLTELRTAMEATFVDALEPKWSPPNWDDYIEVNRARAEGRQPALSQDRLQAHHRAMLRALVKPHRRKIPDQAVAVIVAASEVLPEDDGLLRSARRRHGSEPRTRHDPDLDTMASPSETDDGLDTSSDEVDLEGPMDDLPEPDLLESEAISEAAPEPSDDDSPLVPPSPPADSSPFADSAPPEDTSLSEENEFDQAWTK